VKPAIAGSVRYSSPVHTKAGRQSRDAKHATERTTATVSEYGKSTRSIMWLNSSRRPHILTLAD
jgi:hypothetical protein